MVSLVSVVIPNLHSPVVGEVLSALLEQAEGVPDPLEVWVVGQDRYSQVEPSERVHMLGTAEPVPPSEARNLGAAVSEGEVLVFLDADCIPQPGWLRALLAAWAQWPDAGAISGAMLAEGDSFVIHCGQVAGFHEHLSLNPPGKRRLLASFSLLVPRGVWEAIGGFDPRLRIAEDVDLSVRLRQGGWPLYLASQAKVRHRPARRSWSDLWKYTLFAANLSIEVRRRHKTWLEMPFWMESPWAWVVLSPAIAAVRSLQIYTSVPRLWHYWRCAPWVFLSKLAWCWGAAAGLRAGQDCTPLEV